MKVDDNEKSKAQSSRVLAPPASKRRSTTAKADQALRGRSLAGKTGLPRGGAKERGNGDDDEKEEKAKRPVISAGACQRAGQEMGDDDEDQDEEDEDEDEDEDDEEEEEATRKGERGTRASKKGLCMHCKKATGPGGAQMKLFRCKCGNEFHHLCAGNLGHDDMSSCMDCAN